MEIVVVSIQLEGKQAERTPRETIPTVGVLGLQRSYQVPREVGRPMHSVKEEVWAQIQWQHVSDNEFDWVSVQRSEAVHNLVLVMNLVNGGVQLRVVQKSVGAVERQILYHRAEDHLSEKDWHCRHLFDIRCEWPIRL